MSLGRLRLRLRRVKAKDIWLPVGLMVVFAATRWPGIFPQEWGSFSPAYAICFCAGVYFSRALVWWVPLLTLFVSDVALNIFYYHRPPVTVYMLPNYAMYVALVWLGRRHSPNSSWWRLVFGGVGGAFLFFVVTNTIAWLQDDYPRTFDGWLAAMTTGIPGWPPPWMFLRNSLLSGGLFTGLFAAAMKLTPSSESELDKEPVKAPEGDGEEVPEAESADA